MADPTKPPEMVTVSAAQWENLKREDLLRTLEARVAERLHRRFWVLLTLVVVLCLSATQVIGYLLVSEKLSSAMGRTQSVVAGAPMSEATLRESLAALRRAEEQTSRANNQLAGMSERFDQLNAKIASLESENTRMRAQLERPALPGRPARLERPGAKDEPRIASLPPTPSEPRSSPSQPARPPDYRAFEASSNYEVRLVVVGKTEAKAMPKLESFFTRLGYKVVAEPEPDPTSTRATRQDFVFISYKKGLKPEAQKIERALKYQFHLVTLLSQFDVGNDLAGDIQIAFQEWK